ncbi:MAG: hypothetical protein FWE18_03280 [Alphaproteobacteria bacterium]|nr:hypothetical protein [Alphaproteobacteria bacterium]
MRIKNNAPAGNYQKVQNIFSEAEVYFNTKGTVITNELQVNNNFFI